jgi:hypothetical protein
VTPSERLRSIARRALEDHALAVEAAEALGGFASEPASLVVACRRVLAHHRSHGALWWVCARVLAAADPAATSREAVRLLDGDRTADRLAASIPLLDDDAVVAVVGWPHAVDHALAERLDVAAVSVRVEGVDAAGALRRRQREGAVRTVDVWDLATLDVARLLVPAAAIGTGRAVVPAGTAEVLDLAGTRTEAWLVGGVGRVLPRRLFEALEAAASAASADLDAEELPTQVLALERFDRVAGPRGLESVVDADARPDCPVVPELLRPF